MSGIQHRWDCPVNTRGVALAYAEFVVTVDRTQVRRCLYCHRSAVIDLTEEEQ